MHAGSFVAIKDGVYPTCTAAYCHPNMPFAGTHALEHGAVFISTHVVVTDGPQAFKKNTTFLGKGLL